MTLKQSKIEMTAEQKQKLIDGIYAASVLRKKLKQRSSKNKTQKTK